MAIRKIRLGGEQLGRIQKKHAERVFDEKAISDSKTDGLVASPNVKRIEILNELPPPELQEEGVIYGIYM
jgi:hypothetical protein